MSAANHPTPTEHRPEERRVDLDRDLVAVLGAVAILLLAVACFLGSSALPR